jgi:hypothetical protein
MQTYIYTSLNERFCEKRERVFIGDYQAGGLSLSLLRIYQERTRGGGVLIKEDKRMFW